MSSIQEVRTDKVAAPGGPYSQGVKAGNLLFTSGQGGEGEIEAATREALGKIRAIVEEAGGTLGDVAKVMIYVADFAQYKEVNAVYAEYFTGAVKPARACVQAVLPAGVIVEMDAIAVLSSP